MILTTTGVIGRELSEAYTLKGLAKDIADYIKSEGWEDLDMKDVAEKLSSELREAISSAEHFLKEIEIILLQNESGILDEVERIKSAPVKVPELV